MTRTLLIVQAILCSGLLVFALSCGDNDDGGGDTDSDADTDSDSDTDTDTDTDADGDNCELEGMWTYTGQDDDYEETFTIEGDIMTSIGASGSDYWDFTMELTAFDNETNEFAAEITKSSGTLDYPLGLVFWCAYAPHSDENIIDLYWGEEGEYPEPAGGTEGDDYLEYSRED